MLVQDGKGKAALDPFGHGFQALQIETPALFKQLYSNIAVCLNPGLGQALLKGNVIMNHTIVGKGKGQAVNLTTERMVVVVPFGTSLSRITSMAHHSPGFHRNAELHKAPSPRTLVDLELSPNVVGNAGSVRAANFTLPR